MNNMENNVCRLNILYFDEGHIIWWKMYELDGTMMKYQPRAPHREILTLLFWATYDHGQSQNKRSNKQNQV